MEWVKCSERLPKKEEEVGYTYDGEFINHQVEYDQELGWYIMNWRGSIPINVTHWIPRPEIPKD